MIIEFIETGVHIPLITWDYGQHHSQDAEPNHQNVSRYTMICTFSIDRNEFNYQ